MQLFELFRTHAGLFDAMFLFRKDEPPSWLLADDVSVAIDQAPDGEAILIGFRYGHHMGNFPFPGLLSISFDQFCLKTLLNPCFDALFLDRFLADFVCLC